MILFARAGATPPEHIILRATLAGLTLLRDSDVAGIAPEPILKEPDVPLTPAGTFLACCRVEGAPSKSDGV
jgi:hypothetical protein